MSEIVFVVTAGSYSDYRVCGIYSTREKAERAKDVFNADNDIEEWTLDEMPECPPGLVAWRVHIQKDGAAKASRTEAPVHAHWMELVPYSTSGNGGCTTEMYAADEKHAIKIANERRIQALALGTWNEDWKAWRDGLQRK